MRGLTPAGVAEIVPVSRFGVDALNLVFRADGKVGERLLYRGKESAFEFVEGGRAYAYYRAGVMMDDLVESRTAPRAWVVTHNREQRAKLMEALDEINGRRGRRTIFPAGAGLAQGWRLRAALKSSNWTKRLEELPVALA